MICNLPLTVFCHVFSDWVQIRDIARLDSACCNSHHRPAFLLSLSSSQFVFKNKVDASHESLVVWLLAKNIRASSLLLRIVSQTHFLADYLRKYSKFIRILDVQLAVKVTEYIQLFAIHCKELRFVRFGATQLDPSFKELLWSNPKLEELDLCYARTAEVKPLDGVTLHCLKVLHVRRTNAMKLVWPAGIFGDSLHRAHLDLVDEEQLCTIVKHCRGLKALSLQDQKLSDDLFRQLGSLGPTLLHLDISCNLAITDDGLLAAAQGLPCLRSISTLKCRKLTDLSIKYLADYCGNTLETLYTIVRTENVPALKSIAGKFTKLTTLYVDCWEDVMCISGATFALVQACPQLRTLVITSEKIICQSSRDFISVMRPDLKIEVCRLKGLEFNVMSMPL